MFFHVFLVSLALAFQDQFNTVFFCRILGKTIWFIRWFGLPTLVGDRIRLVGPANPQVGFSSFPSSDPTDTPVLP